MDDEFVSKSKGTNRFCVTIMLINILFYDIAISFWDALQGKVLTYQVLFKGSQNLKDMRDSVVVSNSGSRWRCTYASWTSVPHGFPLNIDTHTFVLSVLIKWFLYRSTIFSLELVNVKD